MGWVLYRTGLSPVSFGLMRSLSCCRSPAHVTQDATNMRGKVGLVLSVRMRPMLRQASPSSPQ
jgi:hypothetical protein